MITGLLYLMVCQLAGEIGARAIGLSVPGPVLGAALLFGLLLWRGHAMAEVERVADGLISHLALLFVPAAVGIVQHGRRLSEEGVAILVSLVISTLLTLVVTVLVFRWAAARAPEERS